MKICPYCKGQVLDSRKKYCSDKCKYWFNLMRKENEIHLPPVKKRTGQYFAMVIGSERAKMKGGQRQGRRSGGMIVGSMSAMIMVVVHKYVPVTVDNIRQHLKGIPGYTPNGIRLGNSEYVKTNDIEARCGIKILP